MDGAASIGDTKWTFGGALLYSVTLLTTVGYSRLSPRTTLGKLAAIVYAIIGVPLMLLLLSALGVLLANGAKKMYSVLCCKARTSKTYHHHAVGYHKAPSSPTIRRNSKNSHEDCALIQLTPHSSSNNVNCKNNHQYSASDHHEVPKKALLATVRSTHVRGRCRQTQVRQMLAEPQVCPQHSHASLARQMTGSICTSELDEAEETDENEHSACTHDTPSRMPLIWHPPGSSKCSSPPPEKSTSPSVPPVLVFSIFVAYVALGAVAFSSTSGWSILDATYFCFLALSTIGIGDKLPESGDFHAQMQMFACCLYLFFGLMVVAMCFSLVQEELTAKCRSFAENLGLLKH